MEDRVDPASRMVHVVVEIPSPFDRSSGGPPLIPGTFVDVRIFGKTVDEVVALPRHAIREGGVVWIVEEGVLRIRPVQIARSDREQALVSGGVSEGDQIVVSSLDAVTDGMKVRAAGPEAEGGGA
jgi:hypothetical protein